MDEVDDGVIHESGDEEDESTVQREMDVNDENVRKPNSRGRKKTRVEKSGSRRISTKRRSSSTLDITDAEDPDDDNQDDLALDEVVVREAGQILLIYVENFMCHRKLTVNSCHHVNFVTGQNGSGKSPNLRESSTNTDFFRKISDCCRCSIMSW